MHGGEVFMTPINTIVPESQGFWEKMAREGVTNPYGYIFPDQPPIPGPNDDPSHPRFQIKKEAKSPKALAHKRKYETEYESTPARKKYRRELERERRKRGVAGKGGGDMSHTKTGKIVVEDPHTNRARSHPSVGSTLKMVIVKEQKKLFVEGQKTLDGQPAFAPTDFVAEQQRRAKAQAEEEAKIARKRAMILQAKRAGMTTPLHEFQQNPE